jgi:hypothetical protein
VKNAYLLRSAMTSTSLRSGDSHSKVITHRNSSHLRLVQIIQSSFWQSIAVFRHCSLSGFDFSHQESGCDSSSGEIR